MQVIAIKPDYAEAYYNRGQGYYDLGELDLAIADWLFVTFGAAWGSYR
jgi:hypothetical protein